MKNIPKTYICTLVDNKERYENVKKNICPYLNDYEIIPAITPDTVDEFVHQNPKFRFSWKIDAIGRNYKKAQALHASFYKVVSSVEDHFIWMEDDAALKEDFEERFLEAFQFFPENRYMFCKLFQRTSIRKMKWLMPPFNAYFNKTFLLWHGTDCIYFSRHAIPHLKKAFRHIWFDIDTTLHFAPNPLKGLIVSSNYLCDETKSCQLSSTLEYPKIFDMFWK